MGFLLPVYLFFVFERGLLCACCLKAVNRNAIGNSVRLQERLGEFAAISGGSSLWPGGVSFPQKSKCFSY